MCERQKLCGYAFFAICSSTYTILLRFFFFFSSFAFRSSKHATYAVCVRVCAVLLSFWSDAITANDRRELSTRSPCAMWWLPRYILCEWQASQVNHICAINACTHFMLILSNSATNKRYACCNRIIYTSFVVRTQQSAIWNERDAIPIWMYARKNVLWNSQLFLWVCHNIVAIYDMTRVMQYGMTCSNENRTPKSRSDHFVSLKET